jgi:TPR repeat protein
MAAVAPTREEIKNAYQSALQSGALQDVAPQAPQAAPVAESMIPADPIRHLDPNEIASALRRGTALIASGDLAAARLVLRRAADAGDARSAMTLAETYDPAILEKLGVHGVVPDLAKARGWYEKAKQFGATEATQRLELLASKQH